MFSYKYSRHSFLKKHLYLITVLLLSSQLTSANTIARVTTPLGDFSIELFDNITPATVSNFLNYVNAGRYDGILFHRSMPSFVLQTGGYTFNEAKYRLDPVTTDMPVKNEFNLSNTRGTIAMAKLGGDPNSATSQWFINLSDNSSHLDGQNGGFTVFGKVIGDGMNVVDIIASLKTYTVAGMSDFPLNNYTSGALVSSNFITINVTQQESTVMAPNYYDEASGELRVTVDAGPAGLASLVFTISATEPDVIVKLELSSIKTIAETVDKIATFDAATGILLLPELFVSGIVAYRNVNFILTDAEQYLFTLGAFQEI
jgi:peptidyl-prolyl cis-trans isomerase A (cyclophilin A)